MSLGISIREFARREGCSDTLVRRALKTSHLKALADGTLDPSLVGTGWRKGNRTGSAEPANTVRTETGETPAQAAERIITATGPTMDQAEAERVKENYLALLRQLEYDQKSGAVVAVADVAAAVGKQFASVRTKLLAIPAEQAPAVHRCKTVVEVQALLLQIITEALEDLTYDGDDAGH